MSQEHERLNNLLLKPHVISEHVSSMLKCQFCILNKLQMLLKDISAMITILCHIEVCIILHNLLLDMKDEIPDSWFDVEDDILAINKSENVDIDA